MADPTGTQGQEMRRPWLPQLCGGGLVALGAMVLAGWAFNLEGPLRVLPGLVSMKPNTALCFLLSGLALWEIREGRAVSRLAIGLSVAVAVIGGLTLFEYLAGVNLGIDQVLLEVPFNESTSLAPGRMHPMTAFNFLVLGMASALLAADREHRAAQGLVLLAALIAGATLIGYLYGVRVFVGLAIFNQLALHTALGMVVQSVGLLLARPGRGLMVSLTDDGPSGLMARWLIPVAILTPIIATGLAIGGIEAGLFDQRYGSAIRVSAVIIVFVACIWRSADSLHRIDRERRRVDAERIEGEQRFQFLAEAMPQIVWVSRADGEVEYLNRRWFDYTGQDPGQAWNWKPVFHPDDLEPCLELWGRRLVSGESFQGEYRFRRHDGVYRWHLVRSEPMRDERGQVVRWVGTSTDINDQKQVGEQRYRSIVEATAAIVWNTPASGMFEVEQPGWSAFTGQSFEQSVGWGRLDAMHPEDREATIQAWVTAIRDRTIYQVKHRLRRHDGEYRHMVARAVPLLDDNGLVREWFGVHTDVEEQERANEAMRVAKEAAEAATRAKAEFLANMSHEIRTPMNGVLGMTELALATDLTPRQREYLGLVKSSADALLTVIDDILDFSKIEAGKLKLESIPFPPHDLVSDTLRCLALKAHEKGLELACRIAPDVPESVVGDPGRLRQVLVNLVGNAIKFTERGEVVVTVEPEPEGTATESVRFSVADTGIGIPPEKRTSIFNPFEQADGSTTRKYGGTGLGLTISTGLIELMGGRIWVEENPGGGSVFRFTARLARGSHGQADRTPHDPIRLHGLRVLVVDDNRTNRLILEEVLSQWNCQPVAVAGATEALAAMDDAADRGEPFSLVLVDRMMPEMDGCELARRLQADPRHARARLLMLTSGGIDESSRSTELGIGAWLAKPVRQSELLGTILDLIGSEEAEPGLFLPELPSPSTTGRLRVLLAEDHPINQQVATRMLQGLGHEVEVVGNGRLALEAIASRTFDVVLMDVQMPEMGGFEALEAIRARERVEGGHLPVVALTAHAMAGDRERCLATGFDDYLAKPVRIVALMEVLARIGDPILVPSAVLDDPPLDPGTFGLEGALEHLDGDESLLREILGLFLEDGGRLPGEIRLAIEGGDAAKLKILGHSLAGSASHLHAEEIVTIARRLEAMGKSGDLTDAEDAAREFDEAFERFRRAVDASRFATESPGSARV